MALRGPTWPRICSEKLEARKAASMLAASKRFFRPPLSKSSSLHAGSPTRRIACTHAPRAAFVASEPANMRLVVRGASGGGDPRAPLSAGQRSPSAP